MRYLSLFFIVSGAVFMCMTINKYHKLLHNFKSSTYNKYSFNRGLQNFTLVLLYIFVLGFLTGFIETVINEVDPIYTFVTSLFMLGSLFIYLLVRNLSRMEFNLREKNVEVMRALVNSIELKDAYTKGHSQHVYNIVDVFYSHLSESYRRRINRIKLLDAAMLHDIGKMCIADNVLNKKGEMTVDEWEMIRRHPLEAKKMLDDTSFKEISDWVYYHHEREDGKGYYSIPGDKIPLESKIISIADTYSALCTNRVYRDRMSHQAALTVMIKEAGKQFDINLLGCFVQIPEEELTSLFPEQE